MVKGIFFLNDFREEAVDKALGLGVNAVFVDYKKLSANLISKLHRSGIKVFAAIGVFNTSCPDEQKVWQEKLSNINNTLLKFKVDGIFLDSIRFPTHWEVPKPQFLDHSNCSVCVEKFRTDTGSREPKGEVWVEWKCQQITSFVAETAKIIQSSGRKIDLGLFAVPWTKSDFDGAIRKVVGQDFERLLTYVDVFSPMTYHKMCGRPVDWIAETVQYFHQLTGKPVLPLVQTENKPTAIPVEEFRQSLNAATRAPSEGVIVFFLEDLLAQPKKLDIVAERFPLKKF